MESNGTFRQCLKFRREFGKLRSRGLGKWCRNLLVISQISQLVVKGVLLGNEHTAMDENK